MKALNEMTIGRTDDPENPISVPAFEAAKLFGAGSRIPSGPADMCRVDRPDTRSQSIRPSEFSSKLLHPRGRPHMHAKPPRAGTWFERRVVAGMRRWDRARSRHSRRSGQCAPTPAERRGLEDRRELLCPGRATAGQPGRSRSLHRHSHGGIARAPDARGRLPRRSCNAFSFGDARLKLRCVAEDRKLMLAIVGWISQVLASR